MAKKKTIEIIDCKECYWSRQHDSTYCSLRLKDENVLIDSAKVETKLDCNYFRKKIVKQ